MAKLNLSRGKWRKVNGANVLVGTTGKIHAGRKAIEAYAKGAKADDFDNAFDDLGDDPGPPKNFKAGSGSTKATIPPPTPPVVKPVLPKPPSGPDRSGEPHKPKKLVGGDGKKLSNYDQDQYLQKTYGYHKDIIDDVPTQDAMRSLQGGGYFGINQDLRAGIPNEKAALLNQAIKKFPPLKEDYTLYRGLKLPDEVRDSLVPGAQFVHTSFPHASTSDKVADSGIFAGNVQFQIRARAGDRALILTRLGESEITYPAGTTLKVKSVKDKEVGGRVVRIVVVDPIVP